MYWCPWPLSNVWDALYSQIEATSISEELAAAVLDRVAFAWQEGILDCVASVSECILRESNYPSTRFFYCSFHVCLATFDSSLPLASLEPSGLKQTLNTLLRAIRLCSTRNVAESVEDFQEHVRIRCAQKLTPTVAHDRAAHDQGYKHLTYARDVLLAFDNFAAPAIEAPSFIDLAIKTDLERALTCVRDTIFTGQSLFYKCVSH